MFKDYYPPKDELYQEYVDYCENGQYEELKKFFILQGGKLNKKIKYSFLLQGLFISIKRKDLKLFDYLLVNIPLDSDTIETLMKYIARYTNSLFLKTLIKFHKRRVEDLIDESEILVVAAENGNKDLIDYLLTTNELPNPNIHFNYDKVLRYACIHEEIEIIKYLLTSNKLKEHANIHVKNDECLIWSFKSEKFKTVDYLLFDYKIEMTPDIDLYMINNRKLADYINEHAAH